MMDEISSVTGIACDPPEQAPIVAVIDWHHPSRMGACVHEAAHVVVGWWCFGIKPTSAEIIGPAGPDETWGGRIELSRPDCGRVAWMTPRQRAMFGLSGAVAEKVWFGASKVNPDAVSDSDWELTGLGLFDRRLWHFAVEELERLLCGPLWLDVIELAHQLYVRSAHPHSLAKLLVPYTSSLSRGYHLPGSPGQEREA